MTKELQDLAWSVLPKEFKEEVKKVARIYSGRTSALFGAERYIANKFLDEFIGLFGLHNLTSDAEGEEMLHIRRSEVIRRYEAYSKESANVKNNESYLQFCEGRLNALTNLFGSKCLPDEIKPTESGRVEEPKHHIPDPAKMMDGIVKDGFREHNRLHIAAMLAAGILANRKLTEWQDIDRETNPGIVKASLRYADALMKAAKRGGGK